jgi:hypothetical protein
MPGRLGAGTLNGSIVSVEHKKVQAGKDAVVDVECLNLWCADGLRSVRLSGSGGGQGAASSAPTGLLADMDEEGRNKESKARGYWAPREFLKQEKARYADDLRRNLGENLALGKSVASAASASKLGDSFQYAIDHPVTLPRQKSALLPILGKDVEGERLSIYNEATHAKFPLLVLMAQHDGDTPTPRQAPRPSAEEPVTVRIRRRSEESAADLLGSS